MTPLTDLPQFSEWVEKIARAICLHRSAPACSCSSTGVCTAPRENLFHITNERGYQANAALLAIAPLIYAQARNEALEEAEHAMHPMLRSMLYRGDAVAAIRALKETTP